MAAEGRWTTSVHNLVMTFRDALAALTPFMDRAKIGWRDEEAYDDWDEIAESLYKNIVLRSILFSSACQDCLATPKYGMAYPAYGDKSFIEVIRRNSPETECQVFIGFSSFDNPFDQVRYQALSRPECHAIGEIICMPLGEAQFIFSVKKKGGIRETVSNFVVEI